MQQETCMDAEILGFTFPIITLYVFLWSQDGHQ